MMSSTFRIASVLVALALSFVQLECANGALSFSREPEIYTAADFIPIARQLGALDDLEDVSPVELVLSDEALTVLCEVESDVVVANTALFWRVVVDGQVFVQPPAAFNSTVSKKVGLLASNFVSFSGKEEADVVIEVSFTENDFSAPELSGSAVVYGVSGFLSILPILVIITLAILTRNIYISMFFGIWCGSLIITRGDLVLSFKELIQVHIVPATSGNIDIIYFTLFLAGFLGIVTRSGGQLGFTKVMSKLAVNNKMAQASTALSGLLLFFDDYANALLVGSSFKPITDAFMISREKLAFLVDSTSAPVASIVPLSSWIGFELGVIQSELDGIHSRFPDTDLDTNAFPFFLDTIASRFYPIFMLLLQFILIVFGIEFGPMLIAERYVRINRRTDGGEGANNAQKADSIVQPSKSTPVMAFNFFIPVVFLIAVMIISAVNIGTENVKASDLELNAQNIFGETDAVLALEFSTLGASIFAAFFYLFQTQRDGELVVPTMKSIIQRIDPRPPKNGIDSEVTESVAIENDSDDSVDLSEKPLLFFSDSITVWIEGVKDMTPAVVVLVLAFSIKTVVKGCATDRFFTDVFVNGDLAPELFPTVIFVMSSLLALCTGTSFGTMSIMFPLVGFAAFQQAEGDVALFTVSMSSILAGAIFGDHSSLISDTTLLSSIGAGCKIENHVYTQFPYAIWGALFAIVLGTLPAGYGAPAGLMLAIGGVALIVVTLLVAAPVVPKSGRFDIFLELWIKIFGSENLKTLKEDTIEFANSSENAEHVDLDVVFFLKNKVKPSAEDLAGSPNPIARAGSPNPMADSL